MPFTSSPPEMGDPRPEDAVLDAAERAEQAGRPAEAITSLEQEVIRLRAQLDESQRSVRNALARCDRLEAELAEARHDRQVLATENGSLREERDQLRHRLSYTPDNNRDDAEAYRYLRDEIINLLNPRDDDASEESIMVDAVTLAAAFIEAQPCACGPDVQEPEWETPCPRCQALGRRADKREER